MVTSQFLDALNVFVAGVQKILTENHAHLNRPGEAPRVTHTIGLTKAKIYSVGPFGYRAVLSEIEIETGKVMLPGDNKKISRGNIHNPDHGLKNIASDGRPAFVR